MKRIRSILCVICIGLGLLTACQTTPADDATTVTTTQFPSGSTGPTDVTTVPTVVPTTQPNNPSGPSGDVTTKPTTKPSGVATTLPTISITPTAPTTKPALQMPYHIPDTGLVIERIDSYDGLYVEDGTNNEITGVAMILLRNMGKKDIDLATITLHYGDLTRTFAVSSLPKGMSAVVQEKNRMPMASAKLEQCSATVIEANSDFQLSSAQISVSENPDNSLTIRNLTSRDLPMVRLFYKYFMEDQQLLVGGITFTVDVTDLKAGQSVTIKPSHYLTGASIVVMALTDEVSQ